MIATNDILRPPDPETESTDAKSETPVDTTPDVLAPPSEQERGILAPPSNNESSLLAPPKQEELQSGNPQGQIGGVPTGIEVTEYSATPTGVPELDDGRVDIRSVRDEINSIDNELSQVKPERTGTPSMAGVPASGAMEELSDERKSKIGSLETRRKLLDRYIAAEYMPLYQNKLNLERERSRLLEKVKQGTAGRNPGAMGADVSRLTDGERLQIEQIDRSIGEIEGRIEEIKPEGFSSRFENALNATAKAAIEAPLLGVKGVAAWTNGEETADSALYNMAESAKIAIDEALPTDPTLQEEFMSSILPSAFGSMASYVAIGSLLSPLGAAATSGGVGAFAGLSGSGQVYDEAKEAGASPEDAAVASRWGFLPGVVQVLPVMRVLDRYDKSTAGQLKSQILKTLQQKGVLGSAKQAASKAGGSAVTGIDEAIAETIGATGQNIIANEIYDANRSLFEGAEESALGGFGAGFSIDAMMTFLGGKRGGPVRITQTAKQKEFNDVIAKINERLYGDPNKGANIQGEGVGEEQGVAPDIQFEWNPDAPASEQQSQLERERGRMEKYREDAVNEGDTDLVGDIDTALEAIDGEIQGLTEQESQPAKEPAKEGDILQEPSTEELSGVQENPFDLSENENLNQNNEVVSELQRLQSEQRTEEQERVDFKDSANRLNEAIEAGDNTLLEEAATDLARSAIQEGARNYNEFFARTSRDRSINDVSGEVFNRGWRNALSDPATDTQLQQNIEEGPNTGVNKVVSDLEARIRRKIQDEFIFVKKRQDEAIRDYKDPEFFRGENESRNTYLAISLMPGSIKDVFDKHLDTQRGYSRISQIQEKIADHGFTMADWKTYGEKITEAAEAESAGRTDRVGALRQEAKEILKEDPLQMYLMAKHAPEYNALHRENNSEAIEAAQDRKATLITRRDDLTQLGKPTTKQKNDLRDVEKSIQEVDSEINFLSNPSGMTDAEAESILNDFNEAEITDNLEDVASDIRAWARERLDMAVEHELIAPTDRENMLSNYENYVPFNRVMTDSYGNITDPEIGEGASGIGALQGRTGSQRDVQHILSNVYGNVASTAVAGAKNQVKKTMAEWVREETSRGNESIGRVVPASQVGTNDSAITFTEVVSEVDVAEDGTTTPVDRKRDMAIVFSDKDLYQAMNQLDGQSVSQFVAGLESMGSVVMPFVNYLRGVRTSFSPSFLFSNPVRDLGAITANSMGMIGPKNAMGMVNNYFRGDARGSEDVQKQKKRFFEVHRQILQAEKTGDTTGVWGELYQELKKLGGTTGFYQIKDHDQVLKDLSKLQEKFTGQVISSTRKANRKNGTQYAQDVVQVFERLNTMMENAARVVAYKAALDSGMSKREAAMYSLDANTNFNRHGEWGVVFKTFYQFTNAGIQGYTAMGRAFKNNPKVMSGVAGGLIAYGALNAAWNDFMDEEKYEKDKKTTNWKYDTNSVIYMPFGDGEITIPYGFGYNIFPSLGGNIYDLTTGKIDEKEFLERTGESLMNAFNPFRGADALADSQNFFYALTPTFLELPVEHILNKRFGGSIYPEYLLNNKDALGLKEWQVKSPYVNPYADYVTRFLAKNNIVDMSPHTIEHVVRYLGGSLGTDMTGLTRAVNSDEARRDGVVIGKNVEGQDIRISPSEIPIVKRAFRIADKDRLAYSYMWNVIDDPDASMAPQGREMMDTLKKLSNNYMTIKKNGGFEQERLEQMEGAINRFVSTNYQNHYRDRALETFASREWDGPEHANQRKAFYNAQSRIAKRSGIRLPRFKDGKIEMYDSKREVYPERVIEQIENRFE